MDDNRRLVALIKQDNLQYVMNEDFERIKSGLRCSPFLDLYTIDYIDMIIEYYEENEEYEKCNILLDKRNDIMNHDKNYLL